MINFISFFSKPPSLKQLPLKRYIINLSLDRLASGVDNVHIDVHISPQVLTAVKRSVAVLMIKHSRSENFFKDDKKERRENEKFALKQICAVLLTEAINTAKSESEIQIDFLCQCSLAKMFLEEVRSGYRKLIRKYENLIRTTELSRQYGQFEWLKMKEKLAEIKQNQNRIVRLVGEEMFQILADVQIRDLKNIRESNYSSEYILPSNFFINPSLHIDNVSDDFLLMDAYVLLGQRTDEPDNYSSIKSIIDDLLRKTDLGPGSTTGGKNENGEIVEEEIPSGNGNAFDPWLMDIDNIDLMFNCFDSREEYKKAKEKKELKDNIPEIKSRTNIQEKMLNLFYRKFRESGLLKLIVATYEMKSLYRDYCPPMRPLQIRDYLVNPGTRKPIVRELKRRGLIKGNNLPLAPLHETIRRIRSNSTRKNRKHLLSFIRDFLRYHRDLENGRFLKSAMDAINLVKDEKILLLSKKNHLLYELPLPEERAEKEKPVIGHVIIKADIRGSMDITQTMKVRGLNPASYFSLNFFDPISEIVRDYDASKEFIEGDAIILSILEKEGMGQNWYSVSRACGLAVNMLNIVRQYNIKNLKHALPVLELGIGICYKQSPPAFLFDGESRIMISHAINLADRLSGCDKRLRRLYKGQDRMFNLYVFQNVRDAEIEATADDLSLRYNLNGIELDPEGFAKLSGEINLKSMEYPAENNEKVTLYTGKVPAIRGKYQRLVIREAVIYEVRPETMEIIGPTSRKYYEVCTQQAIHEFVSNNV